MDQETYLYGRCHLFALVAAEHCGYGIELVWDTDYWFEDAEMPSTVLVHAYNVLPGGQVVDARGVVSKEEMLLDYDYNQAAFEGIAVSNLRSSIKKNIFEDFNEGEYEAILQHLKQHTHNYKVKKNT